MNTLEKRSKIPTATATDAQGSRNKTAVRHNPDSKHREGTTLTDFVTIVPTPRATDGTKGGPNQRGSKGDVALPGYVASLPTVTHARGRLLNPDWVELLMG